MMMNDNDMKQFYFKFNHDDHDGSWIKTEAARFHCSITLMAKAGRGNDLDVMTFVICCRCHFLWLGKKKNQWTMLCILKKRPQTRVSDSFFFFFLLGALLFHLICFSFTFILALTWAVNKKAPSRHIMFIPSLGVDMPVLHG